MDTFVRTNEGTPSYLLRTKVRTKVYIDYICNERNDELRIRRYSMIYKIRYLRIVIIVKMNFIWFFLFCMSVCQAVFHFETV